MKKLLAIIISLALVLSLAACGGAGSDENVSVETPSDENVSVEETENKEEVKDEASQNAEKEEEEIAKDETPEKTPEVAPTVKPEVKPENKPAEKPAEKPADKPTEVVPEAKPEVKPEVVPEEKPSEEPSEKEESSSSTVGDVLASVWRENSSKSAEEIANTVISHSSIQFMGGVVPVEEGFLTGFDNAEIKGFSEGFMFAPAIGTIPFVGYVFTLSDGTDADAFVKTLKESANPRWNICTSAEQTIVEKSGNKVFFLMCPKSFEE